MVRKKTTIEKRLKQINGKIFAIQRLDFITRYKRRKELAHLNGISWGLAWALNKLEHDSRGDHYNAKSKKNY